MKITIDLDNKIISVDENTNMGKLVNFLVEHFEYKWEDYELQTNVTVVMNQPTEYIPYYQPSYIDSTIYPYQPYCDSSINMNGYFQF